MNDTSNGPSEDIGTLRTAARQAARRAHAAGDAELEALIADVEALIARLGQPEDATVAGLCTRVARAVANARRIINTRAAQAQRQARDALAASDSYVHEQPWPAIGAAAVAGLVCALLLFRR